MAPKRTKKIKPIVQQIPLELNGRRMPHLRPLKNNQAQRPPLQNVSNTRPKPAPKRTTRTRTIVKPKIEILSETESGETKPILPKLRKRKLPVTVPAVNKCAQIKLEIKNEDPDSFGSNVAIKKEPEPSTSAGGKLKKTNKNLKVKPIAKDRPPINSKKSIGKTAAVIASKVEPNDGNDASTSLDTMKNTVDTTTFNHKSASGNDFHSDVDSNISNDDPLEIECEEIVQYTVGDDIFVREPFERYGRMRSPFSTDEEDRTGTNPLHISQYASDIFSYLKDKELEFSVDDYMSRQSFVSKTMRAIVVDWMVDLQETLELNPESLYLAVKILDRYLFHCVIAKSQLQLIAATALFISAKYDERYDTMLSDFLKFCESVIDRKDVVKMERKILNTLNFNLGIPLSYCFLKRYAACAKVDRDTRFLALYILEYSLLNYESVCIRESLISCTALFIAMKIRNIDNIWTDEMYNYTGYQLEDFVHCIPIINEGMWSKKYETIYVIKRKYSREKYLGVSRVPLLTTEAILDSLI